MVYPDLGSSSFSEEISVLGWVTYKQLCSGSRKPPKDIPFDFLRMFVPSVLLPFLSYLHQMKVASGSEQGWEKRGSLENMLHVLSAFA